MNALSVIRKRVRKLPPAPALRGGSSWWNPSTRSLRPGRWHGM